MQWFVVSISGITCGGKTTLAHSLREYFQTLVNKTLTEKSAFVLGEVRLISQDDYFLPVEDKRHQWEAQINAINFELLSSLDMNRMLNDIAWTMHDKLLKDNCACDLQQQQTQQLENMRYYNNLANNNNNNNNKKYKNLTNNMNKTQQTTIVKTNKATSSYNNCIILNILIIEGFTIFNQPEILYLSNLKFHFHLPYEKCFERRRKRSYEPPDVTGYFELCVWPHYEQNLSKYRDRKDILFLNGETEREHIFKFVLQKILTHIEQGAMTTSQKKIPMLSVNLRLQHHQKQHQQHQQHQHQQNQACSVPQQ